MYEAQDTALCKYVGELLRNKLPLLNKLDGSGSELNFGSLSSLPQDCLSIGYFLASIAVSCKGNFTIDLGACMFSRRYWHKDSHVKSLQEPGSSQ